MRRVLRIGALAAAVTAAAIQLVRPERTNPPVDPARTLEADIAVSPQAAAVFERACRDCHSSRTRWPWYSQVAPVSWLVAGHVDHARRHLDLSDWARVAPEKRPALAGKMCEEVKEGEMPLPSYLWMHRAARLSAADVEALCAWAEQAQGILAARLRASREGAPASPR